MSALPILARRSLALGLMIVTLLSAWNLILRPLFSATREAVEQLDNVRFELHRLGLLAADAAQSDPDTAHVEIDTLRAELFSVQGSSDSDALFMSAVDQLIRGAGVRLLQLKALPPTRAGSLARYGVDISATASEADFVQLLAAIERHRPLLVVDRLTLVAQGSLGANEAPELSVELRLSGFAGDVDAIASPSRSDAR